MENVNLFGTDGIRGVANRDLSWEIAFRLGRACGLFLPEGPVAVGKDTRISGDMLEAAAIAGLTSAGREALQLGVITTPGLSFGVREMGLPGGIMISASHNPFEYNGLKVFGSNGKKIPDQLEIQFSSYILGKGDASELFPTGSRIGRAKKCERLLDKYVEFLADACGKDLSGLRVACDAANGSTSDIAWRVWEKLGARVEMINNQPDGCNINQSCGSTHPEALAEFVRKGGYDAGFAYDGDGDRCIAVDEAGKIVDGDAIMAIMGIELSKLGKLQGNTVVGTVMSNLGLEVCLKRHGLSLERTSVGDRYVLERMEEKGFVLGGEQSGHIIFRDKSTAGDGILTSVLVAGVIKSTGKKLSDLASVMPVFPQKLVNIKVSRPKEIARRETVIRIVDEMIQKLGDRGRVVVRPSGTEPVIRIMVEAQDQHDVESCIECIAEVVRREDEDKVS